jgi:AcrR family transcriptional regulator
VGKHQFSQIVHYRTFPRKCPKKEAKRMKQQKQDRRSQRTYQLVNAAMMQLLLEKGYESITVQNILDRANIGRSTFYTHYFDKADVLESIAEQMLSGFSQQVQQAEAGRGIIPSLALFRHVQQEHRLFQVLLRGQGEEVVFKAGQAILSRTIEQTLTALCVGKQIPRMPLNVVAQHLAGAFLNLLKWWLEAEMPYPPEQMDAMFQQLALPGVWATLEGKRAAPQRDGF